MRGMHLDLGSVRLQDLTRAQIREAKALAFAQWLGCFGQTRDRELANEWFCERYPRSYGAGLAKKELELQRVDDPVQRRKALVPIGSTTDPNFAGNLVGVDALLGAFIELVHAQSLLGRIPGARQMPFNAKVPIETSGAIYQWVAEGAPKPMSAMNFGAGTVLTPTKSAACLVFTQEFIRGISEQTADSLRRTLSAGLVAFSDGWLLSTNVASPAAPGGLLAGVTPVTSTGNLAADLTALITAFFAARPHAAAATFIASPAKAHAMAGITTGVSSSGVPLPVLVSPAAGSNIVLLDGDALVYAGGTVTIDIAREASVQMNDAPIVPDATTTFRSLWQENLVGFLVESTASWAIAPGAIQYLASA
jgi:hypothetical protein